MIKFRAEREGEVVLLHVNDTETGQAITLRLTLSDAKLMSAMLHIAVEGSEEAQDETENLLGPAPGVPGQE